VTTRDYKESAQEVSLEIDAFQRKLIESKLNLNASASSNNSNDDEIAVWKSEQARGDENDDDKKQQSSSSHNSQNYISDHIDSIGPTLRMNSKEQRLLFRVDAKQLEIEIKPGNILDERVNVIVNAANTQLQLGGGLAGAIRARCGRRVQEDCDKHIMERFGAELDVSEVMHTNSYNLIANVSKYIIHACGPRWHDYAPNEKHMCFELLKNTFFNVLVYVENKLADVESIAVPLISSGIFSVPRELCCKALYDAINEYLVEDIGVDDKKRHLKSIKLINLDKETHADVLSYFKKELTAAISASTKSSCQGKSKKDKESVMNKSNSPTKSSAGCGNNCANCKKSSKNAAAFEKIECGCSFCFDCVNNCQQSGECTNCKRKIKSI
jgi:O-acetyl-ADP-ribose deacetylase